MNKIIRKSNHFFFFERHGAMKIYNPHANN